MRTHSKSSNLWKSYVTSLEHALVPNKKYHDRVNAHVARNSLLTKHLTLVILICAVGISVLLLLTRVPIIEDYIVRAKPASLQQQLSFLLITSSIYMAFSILMLTKKTYGLDIHGHI